MVVSALLLVHEGESLLYIELSTSAQSGDAFMPQSALKTADKESFGIVKCKFCLISLKVSSFNPAHNIFTKSDRIARSH